MHNVVRAASCAKKNSLPTHTNPASWYMKLHPFHRDSLSSQNQAKLTLRKSLRVSFWVHDLTDPKLSLHRLCMFFALKRKTPHEEGRDLHRNWLLIAKMSQGLRRGAVSLSQHRRNSECRIPPEGSHSMQSHWVEREEEIAQQKRSEVCLFSWTLLVRQHQHQEHFRLIEWATCETIPVFFWQQYGFGFSRHQRCVSSFCICQKTKDVKKQRMCSKDSQKSHSESRLDFVHGGDPANPRPRPTKKCTPHVFHKIVAYLGGEYLEFVSTSKVPLWVNVPLTESQHGFTGIAICFLLLYESRSDSLSEPGDSGYFSSMDSNPFTSGI